MSSSVIIDDILPRDQFIATASQTVFNVNWTADVASDVVVYARASGASADDLAQLVSDSNYTVSFIGASRTVRVTFLLGRTLGDIITITRETPAERDNLYINTNFTPSMLNGDFGRRTLVEQQNQLFRTEICPRYNVSEILTQPSSGAGGDIILPKLAPQQIWQMNDDGTAIEAVTFDNDTIPAPSNAYYYVGKADAALTNAKNLGALTAGILKHSVALGISTPATAVSGTDYWAPGNDLTTPNPPTGGTDVTNKTYVDGLISTVSTAQVYLAASSASFPSGKNLGALTTGLLKHTVSGSVSTPATAINTVDYWAPGDDLTRASAPSVAADVTNKQYVDAVAVGFSYLQAAVRVATTANLSATYDNGASGVGATLTATSNGAASVDGVSLSLNDRVLFKNQTTTYENGIYYVSTVGDGSNPAIYTRATDYDEASEISPGDLIPILEGTVNNDTLYLETETVTTMGTDPILFILWSVDADDIVTISGTQTITGQKTFQNANTYFEDAGSGRTLRISPSSGDQTIVSSAGNIVLTPSGANLDIKGSGSNNHLRVYDNADTRYIELIASGGYQQINTSAGNLNITPATGLALLIAPSVDNDLRIYDSASSSYIRLTANSSVKTISTNTSNLNVSPATAITNFFTSGTDGKVRVFDSTGVNYLQLAGSATNQTISTSVGSLVLTPTDNFVIFSASRNAGIYYNSLNVSTGTSARCGNYFTNSTSNFYTYLCGTGFTDVSGWANYGIINPDASTNGLKIYLSAGNDFYLSTTGTNAPDLYMDSSGNVGINQGTPAAKLDVNGTFRLGTSTTINAILDEDDMASNSATALATQQSIKAYIDNLVATNNLTCAFVVTRSTTQSINNITQTKIQYNSETYDPDSIFDSTTNYRATPTTAGRYLVYAHTLMAGAASGAHQSQIRLNGLTQAIGASPFDTSTLGSSSSVGTILSVNGTTDYIEGYVYQDSGGAVNASALWTILVAFYLGS